MLRIVAVGDDAQAQPVEDQVDVARLVFGEVLLAHQAFGLQRAELAQLAVGLRQLQRVRSRLAGELVDEMRNIAAPPHRQGGNGERERGDGGLHGRIVTQKALWC